MRAVLHTLTRWPLPALFIWLAAWLALRLLQALGLAPLWAFAGALALTVLLAAAFVRTRWRMALVLLGFALSALLAGNTWGGLQGHIQSWSWQWLIPLAALLALYPMGAWQDAPLFPTPHAALDGLSAAVPLPSGARILDAGCGSGDGLLELARQYPQAELIGIERSWPLVLLARWRCRQLSARIERGDIWAADWSPYALIYVFQRPESMARVVAKAAQELPSGAWLVSLEFEPQDAKGRTLLAGEAKKTGKAVWLWRR